MPRIVGIDLGTTHSAVAFWDGREPRLIPVLGGGRLLPSVVAFRPEGEVLVGEAARRLLVTEPATTIHAVKRLMGRPFQDAIIDATRLGYEVGCDRHGLAHVIADGRVLGPPEVSAHLLRVLRESAEAHLGEPVDRAIVTVPAHFNDAQRQATREAARLAGLELPRSINEPTAAALAYGLQKQTVGTVAVYDLGGGTFDISILSVGDGVTEVLATSGDTQLGGDDFDGRIVEWLARQFTLQTGVTLRIDRTVLQRLKQAAERAKHDLSTAQQTDVMIPFLAADENGAHHLDVNLTRPVFEGLIGDLVDRTLECSARCLRDARKGASQIDEVLLVGGSCRVPLVARQVQALFGRPPRRTVNPDEAVALGAAVEAALVTGELKGTVLVDVTPLTLGLETWDGAASPLIARNTTLPSQAMRTFSTAEDNQKGVEIHVVQGEAPRAEDNVSLGKFGLWGIRPAAAGVPQIDVTFAIDVSGIVKVTACDRETGTRQAVTFYPDGLEGLGEHGPPIQAAIKAAERVLKDYRAVLDRDLMVGLERALDTLRQLVKNQAPIGAIERGAQKVTDATEAAVATLLARGR